MDVKYKSFMMLLKTYFSFMIFFIANNIVWKTEIVIIGRAKNAKAGAIVISRKDKKIYYVAGIAHGDEKNIGKIVRVSGKLLVERTEAQDQKEKIKQQMVGIKRIIQTPQWVLVK